MANIKSKEKRVLTNKKAQARNKDAKGKARAAITSLKAAETKEEATVLFNLANKYIDMGVSKGVYNKSYASRKKSQIAKIYNAK